MANEQILKITNSLPNEQELFVTLEANCNCYKFIQNEKCEVHLKGEGEMSFEVQIDGNNEVRVFPLGREIKEVYILREDGTLEY